jgi:hypothetical protein
MDFDENIMKIIGYVIAAIVTIAGGSLLAIKISKNKKYKNTQSNITMTGNGNKVVGGDDKSTNN